MLCPHCREYDIEPEEIELEPIYTRAEKTEIEDLKKELDDAYTMIGELSQKKPCTWLQDDYEDISWQSDCGIHWTFPEGSPKENDMRYCPSCGETLIEEFYSEIKDDTR